MIYRPGKKVLTRRGEGTITRDVNGECRDDEVMVRFRTAWNVGVISEETYAQLHSTNIDIFYKAECILCHVPT